MNNEEPTTIRPFVFTVVEDDGVNVTIEIAEEDYLADLAAGCDEDDLSGLYRRDNEARPLLVQARRFSCATSRVQE
jgi:hypothetical protein